MQNKIYIIWTWWIWVSAIARYYLYLWWQVFWNDFIKSELIKNLEKEWVIISELEPILINNKIDKIVYTEAIPSDNLELLLAKKSWIEMLTYPEALANIVNKKKLIAISGTHWKSTTTSLTSLILKNSKTGINTIVWTILKEFWNKNTYFSDSDNFIIEACEYKRSFLKYKPILWVIVNIEIDHLDYYKDLDDYISAYREFLDNIVPGGFAILNWEDKNCKKLLNLRNDINYIEAYNDFFMFNNNKFNYPDITINIPWKHILFDAKIAYIIAHMLEIPDIDILNSLENYSWVWRRMEIIWKTKNNNILMSDYGHHPTEIKLTLDAIKEKYINNPSPLCGTSLKSNGRKKISNIKLFVIFQPHQYNRTLELLEDFKNCFSSADKLIIPDIYESRDSEEDKKKINSKKLISLINHNDKLDWEWLKNTLKLIEKYDKENPNSSIILLLWAWDIDDLRYRIEMK